MLSLFRMIWLETQAAKVVKVVVEREMKHPTRQTCGRDC